MAVWAPMPGAGERMATVVKTGDLRRLRRANSMSRTRSLTIVLTGNLREGYTGGVIRTSDNVFTMAGLNQSQLAFRSESAVQKRASRK
jgi:hypothetical protein